MKRRDALKSIALSTGVVISSGSLLGVLQSCKKQVELSWQPTFFSKEEARVVEIMSDVIIPRDENPGATDVKVTQFIDLLFNDVLDPVEGEKFKVGLFLYSQRFIEMLGQDIHSLNPEAQQHFILDTYALSEEDTKAMLSWVRSGEYEETDKDKFLMWSFLITLRELTISAYFTSEKVGEQVLSYDPIPGVYQPCISVEEVGNVWSI